MSAFTSTDFFEKAQSHAKLGIPVIPLLPRTKVPPSSMAGWQSERKFSTDTVQIRAWHEENPDYNVGIVAMAEDDGFCFLEFDGKPGLKKICEQLGREYPDTRIHRSGRGGRHYIFKHTPESLTLGNRSAARDGIEWFSFRADRKYLVGAGSVHPNGSLYEIVRDTTPIEIPDWLCEFIVENTTVERKFEKSEAHPVTEDFDFDDWCGHYSKIFSIPNAHCKGWMVTDVCPWAEYRHEQSTLTGFYHDGENLGFHCFAAGCEGYGKGIGETIKMMNEKVGEPYPYLVWSEEEPSGFVVEDAEAEPETERPGAIAAKELFADAPAFIQQEIRVEPIEQARTEDHLKMSEDAMYGKLGEMARDMKMPLGLAYPALVTCCTAKVIHDEMDGCRLNVYCCLIAAPGGGKDVARKRACSSLGMSENRDYMVAMPVSDRGIQVLLGDQPPEKKGQPPVSGPKKMLLVTEEIEEVIKKGSIDKSGMFQTLCTLFDGNTKIFSGRGGKSSVNCRLSWLGGIPVNADNVERFASIFGESATHGLLSRFIFGYSGVKWNYRKWEPPTPNTEDDDWRPLTYVKGMTPEAEAFYDAWQSMDETGRDKFYLHKIALVTSSANDEQWVTLECIQAATRFMAWQAKLREMFKPGMAKNTIDAQATERIITTLRRHDEQGKVSTEGYINWRRVSHDNKWAQTYGSTVVVRVMNALIDCGELKPCVEEPGERGKKDKVNKNLVRVVKVSGGENSPAGKQVPPKAA